MAAHAGPSGKGGSIRREYVCAASATSAPSRLALGALLTPSAGVCLDDQALALVFGDATEAPRAMQGKQEPVAGSTNRVEAHGTGKGGQDCGAGQDQAPHGQHGMQGRARGLMQKLLHPHWPTASQHEWVLTARPSSAGPDAALGSALCNRMYTQQHADNELRIALTLVAE